MDRHYVLPVTFAAVAHAALLFGISKEPGAPAMALVKVISDKVFDLTPELEPPVVENEDSGGEKTKTDIETPLIQQPEPTPLVGPSDITIPVPPLQPFRPGDVTKINLPSATSDSVNGN